MNQELRILLGLLPWTISRGGSCNIGLILLQRLDTQAIEQIHYKICLPYDHLTFGVSRGWSPIIELKYHCFCYTTPFARGFPSTTGLTAWAIFPAICRNLGSRAPCRHQRMDGGCTYLLKIANIRNLRAAHLVQHALANDQLNNQDRPKIG